MKRKMMGGITFLMEYGVLVLICIFMHFSSDFTFRFMFLYFMIHIALGHYNARTVLIWQEIRLLVTTHICFYLASVLLIPLVYMNRELIISNFIVTFLMFLFDIVLARFIRICLRSQLASNVLVIGTGKDAATLETVCKTNRFTMMDIQAFINVSDDSYPDIHQDMLVEGEVYPLDQLANVITDKEIDQVIIAVPTMSKKDLDSTMDLFRNCIQKIRYVPLAAGIVTFDSRVDDFDGLLVVSSSDRERNLVSEVIKRLIDIIGGVFGCILLLPLILYVRHVNHKHHDDGPLFFVQQRIGKDGMPFNMYKFRTMVVNAEGVLEELMEKDPTIREEYLTNKKLREDPRVTKAGEFLRKKSLDEFPQLINVLKGDMSLVGPRPYLPREKDDMGLYYTSIVSCKPGITGMWQSHGRNDVGFKERCEMDDYYYHNWNLWLDVTILIKTAKSVFTHTGAL